MAKISISKPKKGKKYLVHPRKNEASAEFWEDSLSNVRAIWREGAQLSWSRTSYDSARANKSFNIHQLKSAFSKIKVS